MSDILRLVRGAPKIQIFSLLAIAGSLFAAGHFNTAPVSAAACGSEPASTTGKSTQTITVPATGTYTIWSRMKAPSTTPVEYQVYLDGECFTVGQTALTAGALTWVDYENGSTVDKATIDLAVGTHTLVLTAGTEDLELDRVMLLSDSCTPTGTGDNCLNDTAQPTTSITSPTDGAAVSATTAIQASATDNDAIDYVEFYRAGTTLLGTDNVAPYSYNWDTTTASDGAHSLTVRAYDLSGNIQTSSAVSVTVNNAPPVNADIASFSAAPTTITDGQSSTLSWTVNAGTGCMIDNSVGGVGLSGSQVVSPTATTTYTLSCSGQNGGAGDTAQTTVTVNPAPVNADIATFTAAPSTITTGQSSTLVWTVNAGQTCTIDQGVGAVAATGNQSVSPTVTTAYTLTCQGLNGGASDSVQATVTFDVSPVNANIASFTASPTTITEGQSSMLGWSVGAGTNCSIDQSVGAVSAAGNQSVSPTVTTTYTMTCQGLNGGASDTESAAVTVNPSPINADITSFTASPASITGAPAQSSILAWSVAAGTACTINQGIGSVTLSSTRAVSPTSTLIYTLTCSGQYGGTSDMATVTVTVTEAPDTDADGVKDYIEAAGPNIGDANYDGTTDSLQSHVVTLMNAKTGDYNTIVAAGDCDVIGSTASLSGATTHILGAWSFALTCDNPGQSSQIEILLDKQYDTAGWRVAKVNTGLTTSRDITTQVTIANKVLGAQTFTSLSYTVTDGGALDEDGAVNGIIVDPVAVLGAEDEVATGSLSNTGESMYVYAGVAAAMVVVATTAIVWKSLPRRAYEDSRL